MFLVRLAARRALRKTCGPAFRPDTLEAQEHRRPVPVRAPFIIQSRSVAGSRTIGMTLFGAGAALLSSSGAIAGTPSAPALMPTAAQWARAFAGDAALRFTLLPWLQLRIRRDQQQKPRVRRTIPAGGWTETVLYEATGTDAVYPNAVIQDSHGALYGTSYFGGVGGIGNVFKLTPPAPGQTAWTASTLYSFAGGADGAYPYGALLVDRQGALYSTTTSGGGTGCGGSGCGTVFKLTPPGAGQTTWTESILYAFTGGSDGGYPAAGLIGIGGNLFGTAESGGAPATGFPSGVAFELSPPTSGQTAWTQTVLYAFTGGNDGGGPAAPLAASGGSLYSTTFDGGNLNAGTVYSLTPPAPGQTAWTESVLHSFDGFDGSGPSSALLIAKNGTLYSTTAFGGYGGCQYYNGTCGTVFALTPPPAGHTGWTNHTLWYFTGGNGSDPANPLTADAHGNIYGMAGGGGPGSSGMVFKLVPPAAGQTAWQLRVLHEFTGADDGGYPFGDNLMRRANGTLLGISQSGSAPCYCGNLFELTP
jgi:hypothetical protein